MTAAIMLQQLHVMPRTSGAFFIGDDRMPALILRACRKRGCAGTTTDRSGYCEMHRNEGWQQQGKSR